MPTFFGAGAVGRTVVCRDDHTQGTTTFLSTNPKLGWTSQKSIITRLMLAYQGNYQFLHTIGNDVYVYVFGDRIGQITISGMSMTSDCGCGAKGGGGDPTGKQHGFELIMAWYQKNRIANRKAPIIITIGSTAIEGFVVGLNGEAADPATRLVQYSLTMMVLPEKQGGGGGGAGNNNNGSEFQPSGDGISSSSNSDSEFQPAGGSDGSGGNGGPTGPPIIVDDPNDYGGGQTYRPDPGFSGPSSGNFDGLAAK